LSDSIVDSHEVGVLRELGDDFTRTHSLSLTCYRGDRHEALFMGSVHPIFDLIKCLCEIPYWEALMETSTPFVPLPVALTSDVLIVGGFNQRVHWQTLRLRICLRNSGQGGSLKVLASRRQP
jgi:hypothetical protein